MKGRKWQKENGAAHVVPLSAQALRVLEELRPFTGHSPLLFPGRDDPTQGITGAAMQKVWARIGYAGQQSTHGLRGLASTEANDSGLFDARVIEVQLSHKEKDRVKGAYDHGQRLAARVRLMDWWGTRLGALCAGGNVVPLTRQV
jgi:integrase